MADLSLDLSSTASPTYKDLLVVNGDLVLTSDVEAAGTNPVLQDIIQSLSMFQGEWFMNNSEGIPWFQQILIKNPDLSKIDAIIQNVIAGRPGVEAILNYSSKFNSSNRSLTITFRVRTTTGTIDYTGAFGPVVTAA